jgi:hypothetical protein
VQVRRGDELCGPLQPTAHCCGWRRLCTGCSKCCCKPGCVHLLLILQVCTVPPGDPCGVAA